MTDPDGIWTFMRRLDAALTAAEEARRQAAKARRNTPEARAVRSEAARRGWIDRRNRENGELAAQATLDALEAEREAHIGTGPHCDSMDHNGIGQETFCILDPRHDGDCEDPDGHTWPNYEKE
ncbi:hypothetical protein [Kitasatospora sp. NPDC086791]|uniref:hypothetical protein n=1 Tax=Kitasatospora sp. NPDC086791 TaxID=3155178 RepID=UPI003445D55D